MISILLGIIVPYVYPYNPSLGKNLTISVPSKITNVDPAQASTTTEMIVTSAYCRPLTRINENGEVEGELLEKWSISDDRRTYVFTLKRNLHFQDGSPVSSNDVQNSLSRHFWSKYKSGYRFHLAFIVGHSNLQKNGWLIPQIRILDEKTLELKMEKPYIPLLRLLSQTSMCIVKKGNPLVGSGPLEIDLFYKGEGWRLKRSTKTANREVSIDSLTIVPQFDLEKIKLDFGSKKIDLIIGNHLENLREEFPGRVKEFDFISINHFLINSDSPLFKSKDTRQLIAEGMQNLAWKPGNIPYGQRISKSIVPNGYFSNNVKTENRDIEQILSQLKKRNFDGFRPIRIFLVGRFFSKNFFKDLQIFFKESKIPYKLDILEGPEWSNVVETKTYDITHLPVMPAAYDPDSLFLNLEGILSGAQKLSYAQEIANYRHLEDKKKRMSAYLNIFRKIMSEYVVIPTYQSSTLYLASEAVILPKTKYKNEFESWKIIKR